MPHTPVVQANPTTVGARFQVESIAGRVVATTTGDKLTHTGVAAVIAALDTYYNTTISTTQRSTLAALTGDRYIDVSATQVSAAAAVGTESTLATALVNVLKTSGNTVAG